MEFEREESSVDSSLEEEEEDVFFDELRRQILQLTAEDDDVYETKKVEARKEGPRTRPVCYYGWPGTGKKEDCGSTTPPAWISNLWKTSGNGTGVFIPQVLQSRRRNRSRRKNERGRAYRKVERVN